MRADCLNHDYYFTPPFMRHGRLRVPTADWRQRRRCFKSNVKGIGLHAGYFFKAGHHD
jgi:hypothetical protein